jgi:putative hydrolase of the HAD superfamily
MKHINHIFFDLDHTLWDFERNSDIAFKTIFDKHQLKVDLGVFFSHYRGINQQYWKLYREEKITKSKLRYGRLKDTFDLMNFSVSDKQIDVLATDYISVLPNNNYLFDGAFEILDYLKPKYKLHIITNGFNEVQYKKIQNAKLDNYFDKIITSEQVGVKKPNNRIFEYALSKANAVAKESIMIGDNWEADIQGAVKNGLNAIYFTQNGTEVDQNVKKVSHLLDIKQYL